MPPFLSISPPSSYSSPTVESIRTHVGEGIVGPLVAKKYGKDLTRLAGRGKLDPLIGWDDQVRQCIQILCKMVKNNPIIICEPGVAKTTIAERLAQKIAQGDVPPMLLNKKLIYLDMESGTNYEKRLKLVLKKEATSSSNGQTILFIDMVHAGATTSGAMDAACYLFRTMFRQEGKLRCVVATTAEEYRESIFERDRVLARHFQRVSCPPPTVIDTISILLGLRERYELHHGVKISEQALVSSAILADRYITDGFMPDKAIDLVNKAAVKQKMEILGRMRTNSRNKFMKFFNLFKEKQELQSSIDVETEATGSSMFLEEVSDLDIAEIVSEYTGIPGSNLIPPVSSKCTGTPVSNLQAAEREKLLRLEDVLKQRVVGQDMAVKPVANAIGRSRAGLSDLNRPIGFMFMGPTGVGKTELAKTLADYLFNTEDALVIMNMSEMGKNAVSRLVGAPPGYEGEALTDVVRRRPYSVILFDWIEKADGDALHILFQILENGRITDSQGSTVSFTNTIIIMTSNIGSELILNTKEVRKKQVVDLARQKFGSRLMDCIDEFVVFKSLDADEISNIVEIEMRQLKERLKKQKNIELHYSKEAIGVLAKLGLDPNRGAWPVKGVIQQLVENEVEMDILRGDFKKDDAVLVDADLNSELKRLVMSKLESDSSIEKV